MIHSRDDRPTSTPCGQRARVSFPCPFGTRLHILTGLDMGVQYIVGLSETELYTFIEDWVFSLTCVRVADLCVFANNLSIGHVPRMYVHSSLEDTSNETHRTERVLKRACQRQERYACDGLRHHDKTRGKERLPHEVRVQISGAPGKFDGWQGAAMMCRTGRGKAAPNTDNVRVRILALHRVHFGYMIITPRGIYTHTHILTPFFSPPPGLKIPSCSTGYTRLGEAAWHYNNCSTAVVVHEG